MARDFAYAATFEIWLTDFKVRRVLFMRKYTHCCTQQSNVWQLAENCQLLVKIRQKCKYISSTRSTSFNYSTILAHRTIVGSFLEMYLYGKFIQSSLVAAIDDWHSALGISINHHTPTKPAIPSKATHSKHIRFECRPVSFPAAHFKFPTRADRKRAYLMDGHSSLFCRDEYAQTIGQTSWANWN